MSAAQENHCKICGKPDVDLYVGGEFTDGRFVGSDAYHQTCRAKRDKMQSVMYELMSRDCGDFTPDQICRALHAALAGNVEKALACINERKNDE